MAKLKTSKKIRKEIHRLSKVYGYSSELEEQYAIHFTNRLGFTYREYLWYLKTTIYHQTMLAIYMEEYKDGRDMLVKEEDGKFKNDKKMSVRTMALTIRDKHPKFWGNRFW